MTDKYIETKYGYDVINGGAKVNVITKVAELTTENASGDIIRFATLPAKAVITRIVIGCTALTGLTDTDLGIYKTNEGDILDADLFMDGQTLATASKSLNGLQTVSVANSNKNIKDLYDVVNTADLQEQFVDVALTLNATPTASGSVSIMIEYC